jgi:hypothetical protein
LGLNREKAGALVAPSEMGLEEENKEMAKKNLAYVFAIVGIVVLATLAPGCATAPAPTTMVGIKGVVKPKIDTSSIQRLVIQPFTGDAAFAQYLTELVTRKIKATGQFTIVTPDDPRADGVFIGNVEGKSTYKRERSGYDGEPIEISNITVSVSISYSIYSTNILKASTDNQLIGTVKKQGRKIFPDTIRYDKYPDWRPIARQIIDSEMGDFEGGILPCLATVDVRELSNETSEDEAVKEKTQAALVLVKENNYAGAIRLYDEISSVYGRDAARTNAAILREAIASANDADVNEKLAQYLDDRNKTTEEYRLAHDAEVQHISDHFIFLPIVGFNWLAEPEKQCFRRADGIKTDLLNVETAATKQEPLADRYVSDVVFVSTSGTDITFRTEDGFATRRMKVLKTREEFDRTKLSPGQKVRIYYTAEPIKDSTVVADLRLADWEIIAIERL